MRQPRMRIIAPAYVRTQIALGPVHQKARLLSCAPDISPSFAPHIQHYHLLLEKKLPPEAMQYSPKAAQEILTFRPETARDLPDTLLNLSKIALETWQFVLETALQTPETNASLRGSDRV